MNIAYWNKIVLSYIMKIYHVLLAYMAIYHVQAERTATPIPNPHSPSPACTCAAQLIDPKSILAKPLLTQADTFLAIETAKVGNVPVPLYNFRQPARLNHQQLPFKILNVMNIGNDAIALSVDKKQADDSWYVGYYWDVLVCTTCGDKTVHIGWKFTSKADSSVSFYSLIVRTNEDNKERSINLSLRQKIAQYLTVGQPASNFILGLLATHTLDTASKINL